MQLVCISMIIRNDEQVFFGGGGGRWVGGRVSILGARASGVRNVSFSENVMYVLSG